MAGFDESDKDKSTVGGFEPKENGADKQPFLKIGEREFATAEDVRKFYENSQSHIKKLEEENSNYREREGVLSKAAADNVSMRELLEGINKAAASQKPSETPSVSRDELVAEAVQIATTQLREELKSERTKEAEEVNLRQAMKVAEEHYGSDYIGKVIEAGRAIGLSGAQINNLAKQNPEVFSRTFIGQVKKASSGPAEGDINTAALKEQPQDRKGGLMKILDNKSRANYVMERIAAKAKQE